MEKTKKCTFCQEEIQIDAIRCKHCKSDLEDTNTSYNKSEYAKYLILSLLLPIVGILIGIVFMTKSNAHAKKMGESILSWSILFIILEGLIFGFLLF